MIELTANVLFSGIGAQERGINNTGCYTCKVLNTSDIDKDATLAYAAIHCGLTKEMIENYNEYPSVEEMVEHLERINLGYDPVKDKVYDWKKIGNKKNKYDLKKYWLAAHLSHNLGDISKIERLPYADLMTLSSPCFVAGTKVLTDNGYKNIEDIGVGDKVMTHTNTYQKVIRTYINDTNVLCKLKTMVSDPIYVTPNHPFYVRKMERKVDHTQIYKYDEKYQRNRYKYVRTFIEPEWKQLKDLSKDYYVGTPINTNSIIPYWNDDEKSKVKVNPLLNKKAFWYMVGRFIGDGWVKGNIENPNTPIGIIICGNEPKMSSLIPCVESLGLKYCISNEKSVKKLTILSNELNKFFTQFGKGAGNKHLTSTVLDLPVDLLKEVLNGIIDSDGHLNKQGVYKITSISNTLLYDIGQCIAKVYHRPFSVYRTKRKPTTVIEGRTVNQKDSYDIAFKLENSIQDHAFYENGYIWSPINKIEYSDCATPVFNMEVENDNSYTVQNIIAHNCTDISLAGKMKGLDPDSGTRSSLLWQCLRLLKTAKEEGNAPKYLLLENVKNLVGKKFIDDFLQFVELMNELGYNSYWKVLNGKECGIPQNRERVFCIWVRKDIDTGKYEFPIPFDNGLRLKDVLQPKEEIDEKYYLSQEVQDRLQITDETLSKNIIGTTKPDFRTIGERDNVYNQEGAMGTLTATSYKQPPQILDNQPVMIQKVGDRDKNPPSYSVHDYSNTIPSNPMSDRGQMVAEKEEPKKEGFFKKIFKW